jgi:Ca2+-binding RTX toxin-like protein
MLDDPISGSRIYETIQNFGKLAEESFDTKAQTEYDNFDELVSSLTSSNQTTQEEAVNSLTGYINSGLFSRFGITGWQAVDVFSSRQGLQYVEFKNESTHQIVLFAIGQQADGVEAQRDQDYTTQPLLHDQVPLTAFELARQYEQIKAANQGYEIILAGHSGGAVDAKLAGAILQYQGESVEVASYGGWGVRSILNNLNFEANPFNLQLDESMFVNFYNSGDGLILSRAGAIDDFGHQYYSPVTDVNSMVASVLNWYSPVQLPNSNVNHELSHLDFSALTSFWQPPVLTAPISLLGSIPTSQLIQSQFISAENILGAMGNDTVQGSTSEDVLVGTRDSVGIQFHDVIYGYEGNDILFGDKGNDTLIGGVGNDTYYGSTGADTFLIRQAEGLDVIRNTFSSKDTLQFSGLTGTSFNRSDIQSISAIGGTIGGQSFGDLIIEFDQNNKVLIEGQFDSSKPYSGVEKVKFDDGEVTLGTLFADNKTGTNGSDVIWTSLGNVRCTP